MRAGLTMPAWADALRNYCDPAEVWWALERAGLHGVLLDGARTVRGLRGPLSTPEPVPVDDEGLVEKVRSLAIGVHSALDLTPPESMAVVQVRDKGYAHGGKRRRDGLVLIAPQAFAHLPIR